MRVALPCVPLRRVRDDAPPTPAALAYGPGG